MSHFHFPNSAKTINTQHKNTIQSVHLKSVFIVLLNDPLVFVVTFHCHLHYLLHACQLLELYLLLILSHLNENIVRNKSQGDSLITITPCSTYSVDICH